VCVLERAGAVPYRFDGDRLRVAVADPGDLVNVDELRLATRHPIELVVAPLNQVRSELRRLIARAPNLNLAPIPMDVDATEEERARHPSCGPSDRRRRGRRDAAAREGALRADAQRHRPLVSDADGHREAQPHVARRVPGKWADRVGEVDDALRGAR